MSASIIIILIGVIGIFYYSQSKLKNKMLCTFIRPNRQRIEKWVPLHSKYVIFDRGKYGIGHYECDPNCITLLWYDRGVQKFFPTIIPTLEFKWDTPNPLDPKTFQSTWHTPEARNAAWEEHQHIAFAKGTAAQVGKKSRFPEWFFPIITVGICVIILFIVYQMGQRLDGIEQLAKLR